MRCVQWGSACFVVMSVLPLGEVLERLARSDASGLDTQAEAAYTQYMHTRSPEQLSVELMEVRHITSLPRWWWCLVAWLCA